MKPLSIFLIRHGESLGNVDKTIYSTIPDWKVPLTERGIQQAKEAGAKLALMIQQDYNHRGNHAFAYYTSPWYRALQTTFHLKETLEALYPMYKTEAVTREDPRIREQDWGNFQEIPLQKKIREDRDRYGSFFFRMPHGESGADVYDRVTTFIDTLYRDFEKKDFAANAIIISHGLTIKTFIMRWFHLSVEDFEKYDTPDNCSIIQMDLQENNKYKLMTELKLYDE
jgi:broad specificity phosphatase PhoE